MTQNDIDLDPETEAARRLAEALEPSAIDALLADAKASGTPIDGVDGLLNQMTKAVLERALQAEMTHHLGTSATTPPGMGRATHEWLFALCYAGIFRTATPDNGAGHSSGVSGVRRFCLDGGRQRARAEGPRNLQPNIALGCHEGRCGAPLVGRASLLHPGRRGATSRPGDPPD